MTPAGWYADPQGHGQRYWDGFNWTEYLRVSAPVAAAPLEVQPVKRDMRADATTMSWVGGMLLSLILPIGGLILGFVWLNRPGTKSHAGKACIVVSILVILLSVAALAVDGGGSTGNGA